MRRILAATLALLALLLILGWDFLRAGPTAAVVAGIWRSDEWYDASGRVTEIVFALSDYRSDHGRFPSKHEGLSALLKDPPTGAATKPRYFPDHYISSDAVLKDPWGNEIIYEPLADGGCQVLSLGSDAKRGGNRSAKDIVEYCLPVPLDARD